MLKAPLGEHRHLQPGHSLDPSRYDLTLQSVQPLHVIVGQLDERNTFRHRNHRRLSKRAEPEKTEVTHWSIGSAVRAAKSAAVSQGVFDLSHTPTLLVQHRVVDHAANRQLRILLNRVILEILAPAVAINQVAPIRIPLAQYPA